MDIILTTFNARYSHTAFGLRWMWSNLGGVQERAAIREFNLSQPPLNIVEALLAENPRIIGFGVYIWNVEAVTQVVQAVKRVAPEVVLVLGGPEVWYEYEDTPVFNAADYLIRGEGEHAFADLCRRLLNGERPLDKVMDAGHVPLDTLSQPYAAYSDEDVSKRLIYVETSRGCPFRCEFCLSSLDPQVREFPLDAFCDDLGRLIDRGARRIKFVDRTFNVKQDRVDTLLRFLLDRWADGLQVHFEIVPDRLTPLMLELMAQFPAGGLRLEVGLQTFNPETQEAISRRQDLDETLANLRFIRENTGAVMHADLVAGLPHETWDSFGRGFDRLIALRPQEVQVGILKRLKGAPITRHEAAGLLVFSPAPPYEILRTHLLDFTQLQRIKRFARYVDIFYNSGKFPRTLDLLLTCEISPFETFMGLADYIWAELGRTHEISLAQQTELLRAFLAPRPGYSSGLLESAIADDFHAKPGRHERLTPPPQMP